MATSSSSAAAAAAAMDVDGAGGGGVTAAAAPFVYEAPLYPRNHTLSALLFEEVTNTEELRAALLSGDLPEFALLNADMVASSLHLLLAGSAALLHERGGGLHVKTRHAELIYALAPSCNISEAFRVFGAGKGDTKVLAAFIDAPPGAVAKVAAAVKGRPVEDVAAALDARPIAEERLARFRKVFKLGAGQPQQRGVKKGKKAQTEGEAEPAAGGQREYEEDWEHAIISRIAAKHVL